MYISAIVCISVLLMRYIFIYPYISFRLYSSFCSIDVLIEHNQFFEPFALFVSSSNFTILIIVKRKSNNYPVNLIRGTPIKVLEWHQTTSNNLRLYLTLPMALYVSTIVLVSENKTAAHVPVSCSRKEIRDNFKQDFRNAMRAYVVVTMKKFVVIE